jgi:hypothetical protein
MHLHQLLSCRRGRCGSQLAQTRQFVRAFAILVHPVLWLCSLHRAPLWFKVNLIATLPRERLMLACEPQDRHA